MHVMVPALILICFILVLGLWGAVWPEKWISAVLAFHGRSTTLRNLSPPSRWEVRTAGLVMFLATASSLCYIFENWP